MTSADTIDSTFKRWVAESLVANYRSLMDDDEQQASHVMTYKLRAARRLFKQAEEQEEADVHA